MCWQVKAAASVEASGPGTSNEPAALLAPVSSSGHDNPLLELLDWEYDEEAVEPSPAASPGPVPLQGGPSPRPSNKARAGSGSEKPESKPDVPAVKHTRPTGFDVKPVSKQHRSEGQSRHGLAAEQTSADQARDRRRASSRSPDRDGAPRDDRSARRAAADVDRQASHRYWPQPCAYLASLTTPVLSLALVPPEYCEIQAVESCARYCRTGHRPIPTDPLYHCPAW